MIANSSARHRLLNNCNARITIAGGDMEWNDDINGGCEDDSLSDEDRLFDLIVGTLEDVLMDESFVELQNTFMERNSKHFSAKDDENKLIYMDIFNSYTAKVEAFIERKLRANIPDFTMSDFLGLLRKRSEQLEGDVFDMLASIGDFQEFKDLILSFRQEKEGTGIDLSGLLAVTNSKSRTK
ncbi:ADP-ribosylation factor-like protein 2-binding protein [Entophlyctis luteolus]|nr:ADP-ribosylation factor-like protein 2-binding protein [Entophlyctis luteolus]